VALKHMRMFQDTNQRDIRRGSTFFFAAAHNFDNSYRDSVVKPSSGMVSAM
jgi:hypothetical protein